MTKCWIEIFRKLTIQLNSDREIRIIYRTINMLLYVVISVWKSITKRYYLSFPVLISILKKEKRNYTCTTFPLRPSSSIDGKTTFAKPIPRLSPHLLLMYMYVLPVFSPSIRKRKRQEIRRETCFQRNRSARTGSPKWPNVWSVQDPDRRARRVNSKPAGRTMRAFIHGVWHHGGAWWCMVEGLTHRAPSKRAPALADRDVLSSGISHYRRVYTYVRITDSCILNYVATLLLQ